MKSWYSIVSKGPQSAEILIFDEIGFFGITAKDFANELKRLGDVKLLTVRINSPGGSVFDGNTIYNLLNKHKARVVTDVEGVALSMASLIAMAGEHRLMAENSLMMIHNPFGGTFGDSDEMRKTADVMDKMKASMVSVYAARSGLDEKKIDKMMDDETWMTADEALEFGFVDEVEGEIELAACFNLDKFVNVPEELKDFVQARNGSVLGADGTSMDVVRTGSALADVTLEDVTMLTKDEIKAAADKAVAEEAAAKEAEARKKEENERVEREVKAARESDAKRRTDIRAVFAPHGDSYRSLLEECLESKLPVSDVRDRLLDEIGKHSMPLQGDTRIQLTADVRDKFRAHVLGGLEMRAGSKPHDGQNEYCGSTLLEVCKACLNQAGVSYRGMSKMEIVGSGFTHSTSDFPFLLANTLGKQLRDAYGNSPDTWSQWCDIGSVPDFKPNDRIQLGSFNSLDIIPEGGEFTAGSFGEDKETIQALTKGKYITMTRQAIINDDLGGFVRIARMLGRAAARTIEIDVYALLQSNPLQRDGIALFNAAHNNLPTGAAPTAVTVGAARTLMRKQKDVDSNDFINLQPSFFLAGVEQEDTVKVLLTSETDPSQANSRKPNPIRNIADLITSPRLNATEWYLVSSANDAALIEVAFLDGNRTPFLESEVGFTVDGTRWKVRLDYGTKAIDHRAGVKGNA